MAAALVAVCGCVRVAVAGWRCVLPLLAAVAGWLGPCPMRQRVRVWLPCGCWGCVAAAACV
jgi:hypothetical protein